MPHDCNIVDCDQCKNSNKLHGVGKKKVTLGLLFNLKVVEWLKQLISSGTHDRCLYTSPAPRLETVPN